jgi:hypothetical protein
MEEKITFSKHALKKLKERKLDVNMVEKVLREPNFIFYDILREIKILSNISGHLEIDKQSLIQSLFGKRK